MANQARRWAFALSMLGGALAPWESPAEASARVLSRHTAKVEAERARAERLHERQLRCFAERETLEAAILERQASCQAEVQQFYECRAERSELEGAELWNCGLGLAMGVASRLAAEPWKLAECGLVEAPESRASCPVPACSLERSDLEREVLQARGLPAMPVCDGSTV
jgi:hypothetical protein